MLILLSWMVQQPFTVKLNRLLISCYNALWPLFPLDISTSNLYLWHNFALLANDSFFQLICSLFSIPFKFHLENELNMTLKFIGHTPIIRFILSIRTLKRSILNSLKVLLFYQIYFCQLDFL